MTESPKKVPWSRMTPRNIKSQFSIDLNELARPANRVSIASMIELLPIQQISNFSEMAEETYSFFSKFRKAMGDPASDDLCESSKSHFVACILIPVINLLKDNCAFTEDLKLHLHAEATIRENESRMDYILMGLKFGSELLKNLVVIEVKKKSTSHAFPQLVCAMLEMHVGGTVYGVCTTSTSWSFVSYAGTPDSWTFSVDFDVLDLGELPQKSVWLQTKSYLLNALYSLFYKRLHLLEIQPEVPGSSSPPTPATTSASASPASFASKSALLIKKLKDVHGKIQALQGTEQQLM